MTSDDTESSVEYEEAEEVPKSWLARQMEGVNTLFVAVLIALAIRAFVIEPFRIPSGSMLPTLLVGDHLFVNKFVYGMKIPFTGVRLPDLREPERGDVIVFTVARDESAIYPADRRPELRVIILSAHTDQEHVLEALRLGAFDYLAKPIHEEELALAVRLTAEDADGAQQLLATPKRRRHPTHHTVTHQHRRLLTRTQGNARRSRQLLLGRQQQPPRRPQCRW